MPTYISREQYLTLSEEEKKKWVAYSPTSDPEIMQSISMADAEAKAAQIIKPLHDKLAALPIEKLPAEKLKEIVEKFEPLVEAKKEIDKLINKPVINELVAPLVNFINSLIEIVGGLFYLIFAISRGQELFLDGIHNTITQINWNELEDAMNELKRKKEQNDKQKEANEKNKKIAKENAEKIKKLIDEKSAEEMNNLKKRVEKAYETLDIAGATAKLQEKIDKTIYFNLTWMGMKSLLVGFFDMIGIDLSPLDQVTPEQAKKFEDTFPNPQSEIDKMNKIINKLNKDTKYILLEELEKIDSEMAESVKKTRAERDAEKAESIEKYKKRQETAKKRMEEIEKDAIKRQKEKEELIEWRRQRDKEIKEANTKTNTIK